MTRFRLTDRIRLSAELDQIADRLEVLNPQIALALDCITDRLDYDIRMAGAATDLFNKLKGFADKIPVVKDVMNLMSGKKPPQIMADIIKKIGMPSDQDIKDAQKLYSMLSKGKTASEIVEAGIFDTFRNIKRTIMTVVLLSVLSGIAGKAFAQSSSDMASQFQDFANKQKTEFAQFVDTSGDEMQKFIDQNEKAFGDFKDNLSDAPSDDKSLDKADVPPSEDKGHDKTNVPPSEDKGHDKTDAKSPTDKSNDKANLGDKDQQQDDESSHSKFFNMAMKVVKDLKSNSGENVPVKGTITINGVSFNIENQHQQKVLEGYADLTLERLMEFDDEGTQEIMSKLMNAIMKKWPNL